MGYLDFLLKWSAECREWARVLLPVFLAGGLGIHLPQPGYMKRKP